MQLCADVCQFIWKIALDNRRQSPSSVPNFGVERAEIRLRHFAKSVGGSEPALPRLAMIDIG